MLPNIHDRHAYRSVARLQLANLPFFFFLLLLLLLPLVLLCTSAISVCLPAPFTRTPSKPPPFVRALCLDYFNPMRIFSTSG